MKFPVMVAVAFAVGAIGGTVLSPGRRAAPAEADAATADSSRAASTADDVVSEGNTAVAASTAMSQDSIREALSQLEPGEAATRLAQMDDALAVQVLRTMSVPEAMRLLSAMDSARAGVLSTLMLTASAGT